MFWSMVRASLADSRGKHLMMLVTMALGVSLATAMLTVLMGVGDKVNAELKAYGANITVLPRGAAVLGELYGADGIEAAAQASLSEEELGDILTIFWALNIVDFAPFLPVTGQVEQSGTPVDVVGTWFQRDLEAPTGETIVTGMRGLRSWWQVEGEWPDDDAPTAAMVGSRLAQDVGVEVGDMMSVRAGGASAELSVEAVFTSGGDEDDQVFVPIALAQLLSERPDAVARVEVSALTTPDNDLARRAAQNPHSLSIKDWETWYCTAYVSAISYQIEEVLTDAVAKPVRQVAESEGAILEKTQLLMLLITGLSLVGTALGISNLVTAGVLERSAEIGLLKAIGAADQAVLRLVLTEVSVVASVGGGVGYLGGVGFAQLIGHAVFGSGIALTPLAIPLVAALVVVVVVAGSLPAIRLLISVRPADVLHGR